MKVQAKNPGKQKSFPIIKKKKKLENNKIKTEKLKQTVDDELERNTGKMKELRKVKIQAKISVKPKSSINKKKKKLENKIKSKTVEELKHVVGDEELETTKSKKVKKIKVTNKEKKLLGYVAEKSRTKKKAKDMNLEALKDLDPEFYDFLKKNDKQLLEFNLLDSDEEDEQNEETVAKKDEKSKESDSEEDDPVDSDEIYHKPTGDLEVASDESDFEADEPTVASPNTQKVTLNLLRQWQLQLEEDNVAIDTIRKVTQAFSSALLSISPDNDQNAPMSYKVVGSATFNGVVQLCVLHLQPAILRFLKVAPHSSIPLQKCKKWNKVRGCLRYYLTDLIRLVEQVSSTNILSVLLKHLHQVAGMLAPFTTLGKLILKRLIVLWSTGDETIRVLAFLCILKITRSQQVTMLNHVLKAMYLSYVRNSKFVSPNTLPAINFMRRSLVEMFALDLNVTYQHAFLYIRQLAIHLRNAVILKKKDSFQACYNWQYINSLRLWSDLLGTTCDKSQLQPLVYPLVTIAFGVIRLIPTAQYFPLRFHCIQSLIDLAKSTHTFIPVLPLVFEVLKSNTFNRKHRTVSMKPMQFTCILRLNKGQLAENGFRDEVVEQVCGLTLEYLAYESASLAFCDLAVHTVIALKSYLKECRNTNYIRKIKLLIDKINENSRFIEQERRKINFGLKDTSQIQAWETTVKNKGTPLDIYHNSWIKTHETKKRRQAAQADNINDDYNLPSIKKLSTKPSVPVKNESGEIELFPSDSEDDVKIPGAEDSHEETVEETPKKKSKKEKKFKKKSTLPEENEYNVPIEEHVEGEDVDIVKDLDLDDW